MIDDTEGTWIDLVRKALESPDLSDEDCTQLLWNTSCFPFGVVDEVVFSLKKSWEAGGRTVAGAVQASYEELDRAVQEAIKRGEWGVRDDG